MRPYRLIFGLSCTLFLLDPQAALAIPSFAAQTGQPCAACHIGAFGPQLTPYGRDFKLNGYVASDRPKDNLIDNWYERLTTAVKTSFTHNNENIYPNAGGVGFGPNDNAAFDQGMVFFGGRITNNIGALAEVSYDGVTRNFFWDAVDIRRAWNFDFMGRDVTAGVTVGNQIGNSTIWNSSPPWGFPYASSGLASTPQASTFLDDTLNGQVMGPGVFYSDGLFYAETAVYFPLSHALDQAIGNPAADNYTTPIPYWHLALEQEFDHHNQYAQIGTFGATATRHPGNDTTTGLTDRMTDWGFEGNYQYLGTGHNIVSAHAGFIHEVEDLKASEVLGGSSIGAGTLNTFKTDVTYAWENTWVPSLQYFKTTGSTNAALYTNSVNGKPDSEGYTVDLAYVPFGKSDSVIQWANARLALQYTGYTRFNGTTKNASDNNTLFLNLWVSLTPFVPAFGGK